MEEISPKFTVGDAFRYLFAYLCWLLTLAIGLVGIFLLRNAWNFLWPAISDNKWLLRPIDRFGLVFLGLLWLVYVIFTEQHFRSAITLARERRMKERREVRVRQPHIQGRFARLLRRMGLDILASRFLPNLMIPMSIVMISYLLEELATLLLSR
jgi:amino acid transporter